MHGQIEPTSSRTGSVQYHDMIGTTWNTYDGQQGILGEGTAGLQWCCQLRQHSEKGSAFAFILEQLLFNNLLHLINLICVVPFHVRPILRSTRP